MNVTEMVQDCFAASVFGDNGQLEVAAKSPDVKISVMVSGTVWVLFRTSVLVGVVVWTTQFPKETLGGLRVWALPIATEKVRVARTNSHGRRIARITPGLAITHLTAIFRRSDLICAQARFDLELKNIFRRNENAA